MTLLWSSSNLLKPFIPRFERSVAHFWLLFESHLVWRLCAILGTQNLFQWWNRYFYSSTVPLICVFETTLTACCEPDYFIFVPYIESTYTHHTYEQFLTTNCQNCSCISNNITCIQPIFVFSLLFDSIKVRFDRPFRCKPAKAHCI